MNTKFGLKKLETLLHRMVQNVFRYRLSELFKRGSRQTELLGILMQLVIIQIQRLFRT